MLLAEAIELAHNGQPHDFTFVAHGTAKKKREGGYTVHMTKAVVTSSYKEKQKMNLKSLDSGQIRWCYFVLLTHIDSEEIFV